VPRHVRHTRGYEKKTRKGGIEADIKIVFFLKWKITLLITQLSVLNWHPHYLYDYTIENTIKQ
jgi:hypothetical protein